MQVILEPDPKTCSCSEVTVCNIALLKMETTNTRFPLTFSSSFNQQVNLILARKKSVVFKCFTGLKLIYRMYL